jgi:5-methylcytosine-specific restriction protein A
VRDKLVDHGNDEAVRTIGRGRSPEWPKVEKAFRKIHPQCVACIVKSVTHIQIHHRFPFHYCTALGRPDLELDPRNLITLCEWKDPAPNHHELVGHLADWSSADLDVATDAIDWRGMSNDEIRKDPRWLAKVAKRLKPLDKMSAADKAAFTKRMNATFPKK